MNENVSAIFKKAILSEDNWSTSLFYLVLEKLKANDVIISFWEEEENWASIIFNSKTVGFVWRKYPLVIF